MQSQSGRAGVGGEGKGEGTRSAVLDGDVAGAPVERVRGAGGPGSAGVGVDPPRRHVAPRALRSYIYYESRSYIDLSYGATIYRFILAPRYNV